MNPSDLSSAPSSRPRNIFTRMLNFLGRRRARARALSQIDLLDSHMLRDIGLTRTDLGRINRQ